jgi:hypothetical protein
MRLFSFITAPERHDYLWVLRAIDRARANYQVVLSTEAVTQALDDPAEHDGDCPRGDEVDLAHPAHRRSGRRPSSARGGPRPGTRTGTSRPRTRGPGGR